MTKKVEKGADPDREPKRDWRWDRSRAWWVPAGDWADDHAMVVVKRGRDPKWYATAHRVGIVAATDTADQAKVALEMWFDSLDDDVEGDAELWDLLRDEVQWISVKPDEDGELRRRCLDLIERARSVRRR